MESLRLKTFWAALFLVIITLFSVDILMWNSAKPYFINEIKNETNDKLNLAKGILNYNKLTKKNSKYLKSFVDKIKTLTGLRTTIIDKNGKTLANSNTPLIKNSALPNNLNFPEIQEALKKNIGFTIRKSKNYNIKLFYYSETLLQNGKIIGFIRVVLPNEFLNNKMRFLTYILILSNLIILIFIMIWSHFYWKYIEKQFNNFKRDINEINNQFTFNLLPTQKYSKFNELAGLINVILGKHRLQLLSKDKDKKQLDRLLNSLNEGVAAFDLSGKLIFNNSNFISILEIEQPSDQNQLIYDWIHFPPIIKDLNEFENNQKKINRRIKYYGNKFIEYNILPMKSFNNITGFIITVVDVTHLQNLETMRTDFVANVSHEFKTPLTSIKGFAETLLSGNVNDINTQKKFLEKIENKTIQLENLVNDLLKLSKIEKREIHQIERINPIPIINDIISEFQSQANDKGLTIEKQDQITRKEVYINANKELLHNIISNLLVNAIYYSPNGGKIVFVFYIKDNMIHLEINDNGIGISQKDQNRIFERFYRIDNARLLFSQGSGLGLSIVKNTVEILNGNYGVESELNKGSKFWIELPLVK